jgi:plasmid maintenance system antidote protein VapI
MRLARYFGGDARSWLNLQTAYDLRVGEISNANPSRERFQQPLLKPYTTGEKALWRAVQFTLASTSPFSRVAAAR